MKFLKDYGLHLFFIMFGMVARYQYDPNKSFAEWCKHALISGFSGSLAIMLVEHYQLSTPMKGFVIGVTSFLADDLLKALMKIGGEFKDNPSKFINRFRGKK